MVDKKIYEKARADVFKKYKAQIRQLERDIKLLDDKNTALAQDLFFMELKDDSLEGSGNATEFKRYHFVYGFQLGMLTDIEEAETIFSVPKEVLKKLFNLTSQGDEIYKA